MKKNKNIQKKAAVSKTQKLDATLKAAQEATAQATVKVKEAKKSEKVAEEKAAEVTNPEMTVDTADLNLDAYAAKVETFLETAPMRGLTVSVTGSTVRYVIREVEKFVEAHAEEFKASPTTTKSVEMCTSAISYSHSCIAQAMSFPQNVTIEIVNGEGSSHSKKFEVTGKEFDVNIYIALLKFVVRRFDVLVRKYIDGLTCPTKEKREFRKEYVKDFLKALGFEFKGTATPKSEPKPEKPRKEPKSKKVVKDAEIAEEGEVVYTAPAEDEEGEVVYTAPAEDDEFAEESENVTEVQDADLIPPVDDEF